MNKINKPTEWYDALKKIETLCDESDPDCKDCPLRGMECTDLFNAARRLRYSIEKGHVPET